MRNFSPSSLYTYTRIFFFSLLSSKKISPRTREDRTLKFRMFRTEQ